MHEPASCSDPSLYAWRTGNECFGWRGGEYTCCESAPALERLQQQWERGGFLSKAVSLAWVDAALATHGTHGDGASSSCFPTLEADCGVGCASLTWLYPTLPLLPWHDGFGRNLDLLFEATETVWSYVQCLAVVDADTDDRACCADEQLYCAEACAPPAGGGGGADVDAPEQCKLLTAGCSMNRYDLADPDPRIHADGCSWDAIASGRCDGCRRPYWCNDADAAGSLDIQTAEQWLDRFHGLKDRAGDAATDYRQCRFKPTQRAQFLQTASAFLRLRSSFGGGDNNEVNVYVGRGNGGVQSAFLDALSALVVWRVTTTDVREGDATRGQLRAEDVDVMTRLQAHLKTLGKRVPIIGIRPAEHYTTRGRGEWTPGERLVLNSGAPYYLELIKDAA